MYACIQSVLGEFTYEDCDTYCLYRWRCDTGINNSYYQCVPIGFSYFGYESESDCVNACRATTTTYNPTTTGGPTSTTGGPPTTTVGPTSTTGNPTSTTGDPTSTTGGPSSTTGRPTSTTGNPTSTTPDCIPPCNTGNCETCSNGMCVSTCSDGATCCDGECCDNICCNNQCCGAGQICCSGQCCDDTVEYQCHYVYLAGLFEPTTIPSGWTKSVSEEGNWFIEKTVPATNGGCPNITIEVDGQFVNPAFAVEEYRTCCPSGCGGLRIC